MSAEQSSPLEGVNRNFFIRNCVFLPDLENTDANAKALREQVGRMDEEGQRYWTEKESWAFLP